MKTSCTSILVAASCAILVSTAQAGPTIMTQSVEIDSPDSIASLGLKPLGANGGQIWNLQSGITGPCFRGPSGGFICPQRNPAAFGIVGASNGVTRFFIGADGKVGIGTINPSQALEVASPGDAQIALRSSDSGGRTWSIQSSRANGLNDVRLSQTFQIVDRTAQKARLTIDTTGKVSVGVLEITGGSDVAEPFDITTHGIPKGAIVSIDAEHPGMLKMSTRAYDTKVAGVVSGANGIKPGVSLRALGQSGQDVALSGRVYVLADARRTPIAPGDLLTSSDIPGYSMRASDRTRAQGAIIGKAMTSLTAGKGMVLALVSLQ
jgi:hypothetical protein